MTGKNEKLVAAEFQAARGWDPNRTRVYYPMMDPKVTVKAARAELARRSCWAYDNSGFIRGLLNNAARMCAQLVPRAQSGDEEWDKLADEAWTKATGNPLVFDLAGKICGESLPESVFLVKFKIGDGLIPFAESETARPRIAFIEGWQIGDDPRAPGNNWWDGVQIDRNGMPRKVRVLDDKRMRQADVDLADAIFFAEYERAGQVRGLPATYHALLDQQDSMEIEAFWKGAIKAASQVGYQIVNSNRGSGLPLGLGHNVTRQKKTSASGAGQPTVDALYQRTIIAEFGDERVELLHDDRPHPNAIAYLEYLKRQMALGLGLPMETVWNLSDLGGANTRAVLLAAQGFVDRQQQWFRVAVGRRLWTWVIAKLVKAGDLPPPPTGLQWWKHDWLPGARMSVDFARDGRIYLELLERGELSPTRYYQWQGLSAITEDRQTIADTRRRMDECAAAGVPYERVFSAPPGSAQAAAAGKDDRQEKDNE